MSRLCVEVLDAIVALEQAFVIFRQRHARIDLGQTGKGGRQAHVVAFVGRRYQLAMPCGAAARPVRQHARSYRMSLAFFPAKRCLTNPISRDGKRSSSQ